MRIKYEPVNESVEEIRREYCLRLKDLEFADNGYFDNTDEAFDMVREFYTGRFATQDDVPDFVKDVFTMTDSSDEYDDEDDE